MRPTGGYENMAGFRLQYHWPQQNTFEALEAFVHHAFADTNTGCNDIGVLGREGALPGYLGTVACALSMALSFIHLNVGKLTVFSDRADELSTQTGTIPLRSVAVARLCETTALYSNLIAYQRMP